MLSLTATQAAMVAKASKSVFWVIFVYDKNGVGYAYATASLNAIAWLTGTSWISGTQWNTSDELTTIVITDFTGIDLRRNQSESAIIAPSDISFNISNKDSTMLYSDFTGGNVLIQLFISDLVSDVLTTSWRFDIKSAEPGYQNIKINCQDFLQKYLKGDYPNTRIVADIFPSNRAYENEGVCIPVPFGTAYVPLRDVYIDGAVTLTAATIGAVASAAGARCQFTDSANGFGIFEQGRIITVSGFTGNAENNGNFEVLSVAPGVIEVELDAGLITEAAAEAITITHGSGYIMLGDPALTYAITMVRSPRAWGQKSEYVSGSYTFTQYTKADEDAVDWRMFQAIIADINKDGTADAPGFWMTEGGPVLDPLVQFTRSDTALMTNPADVIQFVLLDMGVPAVNIDAASFAAAKATFTGWALPFNGAFWYKEQREKVLSKLLNMCHSTLRVGEKIELHVLVAASQKTITQAEILRSSEQGEGSFQFRDLQNDNYSDSGYVTWQETGEPQDRFLKLLAQGTNNILSNEVLECPFVQDSVSVQRIAKLYYQRKLLRIADIGFLAPGTCIALQPDDVITVDHANYGGTYAVLIDSMRINKDLSIQFGCSKFSMTLDDWGYAPAPTAITVPTDDTAFSWQPTVSGPQTDQDIGRPSFELWAKEYLTVGPVANAGKFTDIQKAMNAVKQAGGGAIYILNGTYQAPAPLYVPDVNLEIFGQSQGGVILKNHATDNLFVLHNLTKAFSFERFSIAEQTSGYGFYVYGDTSPDNTANVNIELLSLTDFVSDGIRVERGQTGKLVISNNKFAGSGAGRLVNTHSLANTLDFEVTDNKIVQTTAAGLYAITVYGNAVTVKSNIIAQTGVSGALCIPVLLTGIVKAINNIITTTISDTNMAGTVFYGFQVGAADSSLLDGNTIMLSFAGVKGATLYGINCAGVANGTRGVQVVNNSVSIMATASASEIIRSIYAYKINDSIFSANSIFVHPNNAASDNHYGLYFATSDRNVIGKNNVDLTENTAQDIGIYLDATSDNNQGGDNITVNCGTGILDSGAGNAVTGKDI